MVGSALDEVILQLERFLQPLRSRISSIRLKREP